MLIELTVENLAIIDRTDVTFGPGLSVFTGETGAGKSLIIDAIELVLGGRAEADAVRTGARSASVHLAMDLSSRPDLLALVEAEGVQIEDGLLTLQREVFAEGRSSARLGGKVATVGSLRALSRLLVDMHGQHDHQTLIDPARHVGLLDAWIGEPAVGARDAVAVAYAGFSEAKRRLDRARSGERERERRRDLLSFEVEEIRAVSPVAGEFDELDGQIRRLANQERLLEQSGTALNALSELEGSASEKIGEAISALRAASRLDESVEETLQAAILLQERLAEVVSAVQGYTEMLDLDPGELERLEERRHALVRLRKKYGEDEEAILAYLAEAEAELADMDQGDQNPEALEQELLAAEQRLNEAAAKLTALRKAAIPEFDRGVLQHLGDLALEKARFETHLVPRPVDAEGADTVEFFFSANPGEDLRPLAKVASGGEMSRVMLALKAAMAGKSGPAVLIFDEVDSGLSGRAATAVATKLQTLAEHMQVLVITHLAQVAACGTSHYRIEKHERNGRVVTQVTSLSHEERIDEIARMITGDDLTDSARLHAAELLKKQLQIN
jgi:DNA repair protein RecN (Recombination protein N)